MYIARQFMVPRAIVKLNSAHRGIFAKVGFMAVSGLMIPNGSMTNRNQ